MKQIFLSVLGTFFFAASLCAQSPDSGFVQMDTIQPQPFADKVDSVKKSVASKPVFKLENRLVNGNVEPVTHAVQFKNTRSEDGLFYIIAGLILLLAIIKYFNSRYFTNLFRVFFNTSLRQSQLTDQLLQAKFPSLLFNVFFILSGGLYAYLLLLHYKLIVDDYNWLLIFSSIALLGVVYFTKFVILKFTGWISGHAEATDTYIFVIFLINKIIGIFLIPFVVILAFSDSTIINIAALISLMSIIIFLLLRFFRSYGLLQNQLKISRYHFILYILGIEILPLLLIYNGLMIFLNKNL